VDSPHSAKDIYLAYVYQSMQALSLLLSIQDDDITVRLEAEDDLTLIQQGTFSLGQVKHTKEPIGKKSSDLWRTLRIWCDYIQTNGTSNTYFMLLTTSKIQTSSILSCLKPENKTIKNTHIPTLQKELNEEAHRVVHARESDANRKTLSYQKKYQGCESFLKIESSQQAKLLQRMTILDQQPNIKDINKKIHDKLLFVPSNIRKDTTKKILEWWQHTVLESLMHSSKCNLSRNCVLEKINEIAFFLRNNILTDDMAHLSLPDNIPLPKNISKQLEIIGAIPSRSKRSAKMHWLATEQRNRWVDDNPGNSLKIEQYDIKLVSNWEDMFNATCSVELLCEDNKKAKGMTVLDWSHQNAHTQVAPIRENWNNPDYVRGSFQILSNYLRVGWHPDFKLLLGVGDDSK